MVYITNKIELTIEEFDLLMKLICYFHESLEINTYTCKTCKYEQSWFPNKWDMSMCKDCGSYTHWEMSEEIERNIEIYCKLRDLKKRRDTIEDHMDIS